MTDAKKMALLVAVAIYDTIKEAGPNGAPAGGLYAALMERGASLESFEKLMAMLVSTGRVRKSGHVYYAVD